MHVIQSIIKHNSSSNNFGNNNIALETPCRPYSCIRVAAAGGAVQQLLHLHVRAVTRLGPIHSAAAGGRSRRLRHTTAAAAQCSVLLSALKMSICLGLLLLLSMLHFPAASEIIRQKPGAKPYKVEVWVAEEGWICNEWIRADKPEKAPLQAAAQSTIEPEKAPLQAAAQPTTVKAKSDSDGWIRVLKKGGCKYYHGCITTFGPHCRPTGMTPENKPCYE